MNPVKQNIMLMLRYEIAFQPTSQRGGSMHVNVRAHTIHTYTHTHTLYLPFNSKGGIWFSFGVWKTHCSVCAAAGPIMISMQIYIWLLSYLCFVKWCEFYFSISCCQQVASLWILRWKMLILLLRFQRVTIWQPIYNPVCACVYVCVREKVCVWSLLKVSQAVLSMALTIPPPCGRSWGAVCIAWPSSWTFFMSCWCHRKEVKAPPEACKVVRRLSQSYI